jgi:acetylglutamate kinase
MESFRARKKQTEGYDLGFVGEICSVEPRWMEAIWNEGGIPSSSLALGSDGEYYNVSMINGISLRNRLSR